MLKRVLCCGMALIATPAEAGDPVTYGASIDSLPLLLADRRATWGTPRPATGFVAVSSPGIARMTIGFERRIPAPPASIDPRPASTDMRDFDRWASPRFSLPDASDKSPYRSIDRIAAVARQSLPWRSPANPDPDTRGVQDLARTESELAVAGLSKPARRMTPLQAMLVLTVNSNDESSFRIDGGIASVLWDALPKQ